MCLKENLNNKTKEELGEIIITKLKELIEICKESNLKQKLERFEFIRHQGRYNMLDEETRKLTRISKDDYRYIIEHYEELIKKYPDVKVQVKLRLDYIKSANIAKAIVMKGCNNCIELVSRKLDVNMNDLCEECKKEVAPYIDSISKMYNI